MEVEDILIIAKTPLHPTEDPAKVAKCFTNITEDSHVEEEKTTEGIFLLIKSSEKQTLMLIREKLRHQCILSSARKILLRNMTEDSVKFNLNKQAAYAGRVHFVKDQKNEDFLGPIAFTIRSDNIQELIDWLTSMEYQKKV